MQVNVLKWARTWMLRFRRSWWVQALKYFIFVLAKEKPVQFSFSVCSFILMLVWPINKHFSDIFTSFSLYQSHTYSKRKTVFRQGLHRVCICVLLKWKPFFVRLGTISTITQSRVNCAFFYIQLNSIIADYWPFQTRYELGGWSRFISVALTPFIMKPKLREPHTI